METIVAIDLGKNKSVFCEFDRQSLKTQGEINAPGAISHKQTSDWPAVVSPLTPNYEPRTTNSLFGPLNLLSPDASASTLDTSCPSSFFNTFRI